MQGVFATDLSLADIRRLRARQAKQFRDQAFNDQYSVPTLEEFIDLAQAAPRPVGIYPEVRMSGTAGSAAPCLLRKQLQGRLELELDIARLCR